MLIFELAANRRSSTKTASKLEVQDQETWILAAPTGPKIRQ
jgi:hypothetical protein